MAWYKPPSVNLLGFPFPFQNVTVPGSALPDVLSLILELKFYLVLLLFACRACSWVRSFLRGGSSSWPELPQLSCPSHPSFLCLALGVSAHGGGASLVPTSVNSPGHGAACPTCRANASSVPVGRSERGNSCPLALLSPLASHPGFSLPTVAFELLEQPHHGC